MACSADDLSPEEGILPEPADITLETDYVEWAIAPEMEVCAGTVAHLDRFIELYLERSLTGTLEEKIRYFLIPREQADELCGAGARACASRGSIYTANAPDIHEAVHAIRRRQPAPRGMEFFEEAWAQLYSFESAGWTDDASILAALDYVHEPPPGPYYDRGAHLLSFLSTRHGIGPVEDFVNQTEAVEVESELDAAMRDTLGKGLGEVQDAYNTFEECSKIASTQLLVACAQDPLDWGAPQPAIGAPERIVWGTGDFGCDHPDAVGPFNDRVWISSSFEVSTAGEYDLVFSSSSQDVQTSLVACERSCDGDVDFENSGGMFSSHVVFLEPGRYVFQQSRAYGDAGGIGFSISRKE